MSEHLKSVSASEFDSVVLEASKPVLVDFWAEWCAPCKALMPIVNEVAGESEFKDSLAFVKLNVDEGGEIAAKFGVRGIPTLMLFKSGKVVATKVGQVTKTQLVEFLNENV